MYGTVILYSINGTVILYSIKCSYLIVDDLKNINGKPRLFGCYNKFNNCPFSKFDIISHNSSMYCKSTSYDPDKMGTVTFNWIDYVRYKHLFIK